MSPARIAYVMSRFPHLPETFILREMSEMERQGWSVSLYPLILQAQAVVHEETRPWLARAHRLPFLSPAVVAANLRAFLRRPLLLSRLWLQVLRENLSSPNMLVRSLLLFPKAVYAAQEMQKEGIEHIHAHYATYPALAAWIIHQLTGIPYSVTVHAHDIFVRTAMAGTKLSEAAFVIAISNYNREVVTRLAGEQTRAKTYVVHCGIRPQNYPQSTPESRQTLKIISIGSLEPYKGQRHLIEACALLKKRGIPFHCQIIGGGEERANLEKTIQDHQLQNEVSLLGAKPQEEVARLLPAANCYVQPSIITPSGKMEGIPVAMMEAMACRLPVVASRLSGIPELIEPNVTGYLVQPADAVALADALEKIHTDPQASERMALAGRERVLKEFDLQSNVARLSEILSNSRSRPHGD